MGGLADPLLTRLHFHDTKTQRAAQAEYVDVPKRGNHGTLSAQLHNEKSSALPVSIQHGMLSMAVTETLARLRQQGTRKKKKKHHTNSIQSVERKKKTSSDTNTTVSTIVLTTWTY